MTDHIPDAGKMVPTDRQVNILTDELHNANADVKRFRAAASCERDVRVELEKQVGTLQAEVRRLYAEVQMQFQALKAARQLVEACYQSAKKDEALLWLCREVIRELPVVHPQQGPRRDELIEALNKRLSNG